MKAKLLALVLFAASAVFAQVGVGIRIGAPPPMRAMGIQPQSPGPGYAWVGGYWYPVNHHYRWHEGYYTRPAYAGAHWVEPRHDGRLYYQGYWDGDHGRVAHDHRWDHERDHRDYDRH